MKQLSIITIICAITLLLAACSTPSGNASATHKGARGHMDIFKIPLP